MAEEDQRAAWEADVAGGDRREAERGEGSNDSRHEQMDSCICSEGIRFLEAAQSPRASVVTSSASSALRANGPLARRSVCAAPAPCAEGPPPRWRSQARRLYWPLSARLPVRRVRPPRPVCQAAMPLPAMGARRSRTLAP